ncbi:MAG: DUF1028 domain-containing protein [Acetobacteraceae bacterium]
MTFSLAGRCARTGMLGVAVTTSSIAVGSRCGYAKAGVGAVLTQHRTDPRLGPLGIALLEARKDAQATVREIARSTPERDWRQLAAIDAGGGTGFFHGAHIRSVHAGVQAEDCVAIGNILADIGVPAAMAAAFARDPAEPLAERLVRGLEAGLSAGGERGPVRSAHVLVVYQHSFPYVDLRVDEADAPIAALRALWTAYEPQADDYVARAIDPASLGPTQA